VLDFEPWAVRLDARDLARGVGALGTLRGEQLEVSIGDTLGVRGRVALESNDVEIFGRRYLIEPTDSGPSGVVFDGTTDPLVNLRMTYQFPDLQLRVDASGRLSQIERPRFSSDPGGYTQDQLFAFFLGAEPSTEPGNPGRDQAREAVAGASTRLLSGLLGKQINKVLPVKVDSLSCEPAPATTATTTASGSCTVGKWLSQQLYLSYRQHLQPRSDENTGDAQVQFRLGSRFLLEGTGGDRGYYGADLLWRHRW
jgi:autotransporter translocation and assembly factor TamB